MKSWMWSTVLLLAATGLTYFLFHNFLRVPPGVAQFDEVTSLYANNKLVKTLTPMNHSQRSEWGAKLGVGHQTALYRTLSNVSMLNAAPPIDWSGVRTERALYDGVPVLVFLPDNLSNRGPALIWIHGGGWVHGTAEGRSDLSVELARRLGVPVVSIEYRLAPEHPFPTPLEDCVRATKYFLQTGAEKYRVDAQRVAIAGASAGGNLAAAVSLRLRNDGFPVQLHLQVLVVPCLQAVDFLTPSYQQNADDAILPRSWMTKFWLWYALGSNGHEHAHVAASNAHTSPDSKLEPYMKFVDHNLVPRKYVHQYYAPSEVGFGDEAVWEKLKDTFLDPYFAPLMSPQLKGLPAAYIITAEHDPLRDDGVMYAKRLEGAGVEVTHQHYVGCHTLLFYFRTLRESERMLADLVEFLKRKL